MVSLGHVVLPPKFSQFLMTLKDGFLFSSDTLLMIEQFHRLFIDSKAQKELFFMNFKKRDYNYLRLS